MTRRVIKSEYDSRCNGEADNMLSISTLSSKQKDFNGNNLSCIQEKSENYFS